MSNMKVIHRESDKIALAQFIQSRIIYEHKHKLDHNSRNYEVRIGFKNAGLIPEYTNDEAFGDYHVTSSTDLDVISNASLKKLDIKRMRKVELLGKCECFKCVPKAQLKVNVPKDLIVDE